MQVSVDGLQHLTITIFKSGDFMIMIINTDFNFVKTSQTRLRKNGPRLFAIKRNIKRNKV